MRVAVTGANGFVGRRLIEALVLGGHNVRALVRHPDASLADYPIEIIATGAIESIDDWRPYLTGIDTVVHLAARAHLDAKDMLDMARIRAVNTDATLRLCRSAAKRNIGHFISLSSVSVNGERSTPDHPFSATSPLAPTTAYASSKADAETGLQAIHNDSKMPISILRPPVIYGEGARGNFQQLCALTFKAPALPLASLKAKRAMIDVKNLGDALAQLVSHPAAGLNAYPVSDADSFSLPELIRLIGEGVGKTPILLPMPAFALKTAAALAGKSGAFRKAAEPLSIDMSDFCKTFSWTPPFAAGERIVAAARFFAQNKGK